MKALVPSKRKDAIKKGKPGAGFRQKVKIEPIVEPEAPPIESKPKIDRKALRKKRWGEKELDQMFTRREELIKKGHTDSEIAGILEGEIGRSKKAIVMILRKNMRTGEIPENPNTSLVKGLSLEDKKAIRMAISKMKLHNLRTFKELLDKFPNVARQLMKGRRMEAFQKAVKRELGG